MANHYCCHVNSVDISQVRTIVLTLEYQINGCSQRKRNGEWGLTCGGGVRFISLMQVDEFILLCVPFFSNFATLGILNLKMFPIPKNKVEHFSLFLKIKFQNLISGEG